MQGQHGSPLTKLLPVIGFRHFSPLGLYVTGDPRQLFPGFATMGSFFPGNGFAVHDFHETTVEQ